MVTTRSIGSWSTTAGTRAGWAATSLPSSRALSSFDNRRRARPKRIALASDMSSSGHGALPATRISQFVRRTRGPTVAVGTPKPALNPAAMESGATAAQAIMRF